MATINSGTPYYIKSDAIAVFPCANRTNSYASRFTTEYNLTHLGLPNASWISKVDGKITGGTVAASDKISCVINGYFFEFSLDYAYSIDGSKLSLDDDSTLTAYIATEVITDPTDPTDPSKPADPLKKQPQLCALLTQDNTSQSAALDVNDLFLGLAIFVGDGTPSIIGATAYSLQLASSGNYPYIGLMPQMPQSAITTNRISNNAVTTDKIAAGAVTAAKLGGDVVNSTIDKLGGDATNTLGVTLTRDNNNKIKAELSGPVGTADIGNYAVIQTKIGRGAVTADKLAEMAVTAPKLGQVVHTAPSTANGITVSLQQITGAIAIKVDSSKVTNAGTADIAKEIKIGNNAYTLSLSGNVLTLTKAQ